MPFPQRLPTSTTLAVLAHSLLLGCGSAQTKEAPLPTQPSKELPLEAPAEVSPKAAPLPTLPWEAETFSPRPASPGEPDLDELLHVCGTGDQPLHEVAQWVAETQAARGQAATPDEVRFHLHRRGAPYVMPRVWSAVTEGVSYRDLKDHIQAWAKRRPPLGQFRCGAGMSEARQGRVVTLIQVDVLAELQPLPTHARGGAMIPFEARLGPDSTAATVVLLPPEGRPHTIEPTIEHGLVTAKLSLPSEGTWLVQLMATRVGGPRPVAEALITIGQERPSYPDQEEVPGERAYDAALPPADGLFAMMNEARASEGLPALKRTRALDALALSHSQAMSKQGRVSHDTGQGDPARRVEVAGIAAAAAGENMALAQSVVRLHRVLWASPSHRENLLLRRWEEAGVGVAPGEGDNLFATELFIDH